MQSRVEQLVVRVQEEREKYIYALEAFFALKDKLADALDRLDMAEKEVILAFYLDGVPNWKVGQIVHCSESSVKRYKRRGLKKIADFL